MRVLHAAAVLTPPLGVVNQMRWEQDAADRLGLAWDARIYCPPENIADDRIAVPAVRPLFELGSTKLNKLSAWVALRVGYYRWLEVQAHKYDVILLRYYPHDPFQLRFVRQSRANVYLVHHTLEAKELRSAGGLKGHMRGFLDDVFGPSSIRECAGLIGVTREIVEYEKERSGSIEGSEHVYPNGVTYAGSVADDKRSLALFPEILFTASSFIDWHGLDLLLDAAAKDSRQFLVHLVGDVPASERERALADGRFKVHGRLSNERIFELAARCSVGLSSFALWRKGMQEACTLKVREYLMLGLPVYAGHRDVFPSTFEYYRTGPPRFSSIMSYAAEVQGVSREEVSVVARPYIDKDFLLLRLWNDLLCNRTATDVLTS